MNIVEYAERAIAFPLSQFQKEFLKGYEQDVMEGKKMYCIPARNVGKQMLIDIINDFENLE